MKIIKPNGKFLNLREYYPDGGVYTPMTKAEILTILGAASETNDGYLSKEDYATFKNGITTGSAVPLLEIDMGSIVTPNLKFSFDLGTF